MRAVDSQVNSSRQETIKEIAHGGKPSSKVHQKYRAREIHFLGGLAAKENRATSNMSYEQGNVLMPSK